ncbi:MAG TPA: 23S rRNA (guanosine(2251)-2'-O)-methyltransferase RlmB [Lautropia sp.]|nr:23S rRNA (guanosine(2251)-2'-O)-methyltransferase RlmB [Lautropia sp.]
MLLFGFHSVTARLKQSPESVKTLYLDRDRVDARGRDLQKLAAEKSIAISLVGGERLDRMCFGKRHQGVVALVEATVPRLALAQLLEEVKDADPPPLLLLLDGVTDPRNLGACLRVADGAGAHAVIAPKDHSCLLTDVVIHTASGAAESVPYILVTNLARAVEDLQIAGFTVFGTADDAEKSVYAADLSGPVAWVLGSEDKGLRRLVREHCDELVSIPMLGSVESLNVSVATGVVLYETVRQRQIAQGSPSN